MNQIWTTYLKYKHLYTFMYEELMGNILVSIVWGYKSKSVCKCATWKLYSTIQSGFALGKSHLFIKWQVWYTNYSPLETSFSFQPVLKYACLSRAPSLSGLALIILRRICNRWATVVRFSDYMHCSAAIDFCTPGSSVYAGRFPRTARLCLGNEWAGGHFIL